MSRRGAARAFFVYILSNQTHTLYTGVTNDLERRIYEHKNHVLGGFTARYGIDELVYFEEYDSAETAIAREKQIKGWVRRKKVALIESTNPDWNDLSIDTSLTPPSHSERSEESAGKTEG